MSKMIKVSDQDYARIQDAADADEMPVDEWVVAHLPLNGNGNGNAKAEQVPPSTNEKPAKTMYDRFAGRLGVVASEGHERLSENTGEKFTDYLEQKQRAGNL